MWINRGSVFRFVIVTLAVALQLCTHASAQTIEFRVPAGAPDSAAAPPSSSVVPTAGGRPYGIAVGPDGHLWFTEKSGNRIARAATSTSMKFGAGGTASAASSNAALVPGSLATATGSFGLSSGHSAPGAPYPTSLDGLSLQFANSVQAPVLYVSGSQVDFQVPWELAGQTGSTLTVSLNGSASTENVSLAPFAPGLFSVNGQGSGQGAIVDSSNELVNAANPAIAGATTITIYATGLGPVSNQPATGAAAPANTLAATTATPTVTIGGIAAQVASSSLTPGDVGVYQIKALVPASAPVSNTVPVVVSIGGATSNSVTMAVSVPATTGSLQVQITGLPAGSVGSVSITSASGFSQTISASQTLQVPSGAYNLKPGPVVAGTLTYYAQASTAVSVRTGTSTTVQITYNTAIPNTTRILDQTATQGLTLSTDGSTLTLPGTSGAAQSLAAGNVLAIGVTPATPYGLLRKVTAVTQSGSQVVATTTPATLADAFQQLNLKSNTALDAQKLTTTGALSPGVKVRRAYRNIKVPGASGTGSGVTCGSETAVLVEMLDATIAKDSHGSLTATGEIDICPSLEFDLQYSLFPPSINSMTATATITGDFHVNVAGQYAASFDKQVPVATLVSEPVPVDVFGVPVVLTPSITVFVGASGEANGSFSAGATQTASLTGGITYNGSQVSPVNNWTYAFVPDTTALDASLSAKVYAGTTLALEIDGILSPQLSPDAFLQLDVNPLANPWWTLSGGMELSGSVDVSVIGIGKNFDFPGLFKLSHQFAQASGGILPSDTTPVLSSTNPASSYAGGSDLSLTATGTNFVPGSSVSFNQTALTTVFVSPTQLTATVPAALIAASGTYPVTVTNPPPQGGASQPVSFTVQGTAPPSGGPSLANLITTVAGDGIPGHSGDGGPAIGARLSSVLGLAVDSAGNLYIADEGNNSVRKVAPDGTIQAIAGSSNGYSGFSGDGGPASAALLYDPRGLAVDAAGNVFIADSGNGRIRKIGTNGIISTIAGGGLQDPGDGGNATNAYLVFPEGLAFDSGGSLYISQYDGRIRKVTPDGMIATIAGSKNAYSYSGDGGPAVKATLANPYGIALDSKGNVFIADWGNRRIRKIATDGTISTVAGNGACCYSGDNGPAVNAELNTPFWVAVDGVGTLYFTDENNQRVREVTADGTISTLAGNGDSGYSGDGGPAGAAELEAPAGIALDAQGSVYFSDAYACVVRRISAAASPAGAAILGAGSDGKLYRIFPPLGETTLIGDLPTIMTDIASYNGSLFGISSDQPSVLYRIEPHTGLGTSIGTNTGATLNALTFSSGGLLYAAGGEKLYTMDTVSGVATPVGSGSGSSTYSSSGDLEFDGAGNLYLTSSSSSGTDQLFSINPFSGQGTLIGNTGFNSLYGLAFLGGTMYGFTNYGEVLTLNLGTGAAKQIAAYSPSFFGTTVYTPPSGQGLNDYPWSNATADAVNPFTDFYYRECTDFVAWRINRDKGMTDPAQFWFTDPMPSTANEWGNAGNWAQHAQSLGYPVDNKPAVGAIAQYKAGECGGCTLGHVAYVESVNPDGSVNVSEYNFGKGYPSNYNYRPSVLPPRFIHILH